MSAIIMMASSSHYFVLFLLCILSCHDRIVEKEIEAEKETSEDNLPKLDLKFKEGETIKVNLNIMKNKNSSRPKKSGTGILLPPPPPGTGKLLPPPPTSSSSKNDDASDGDLVFGIETLSMTSDPKATDTTSLEASSTCSGWAQF